MRVALPVSAGAAIYVAASDLIPAVNEAKGIKKPLGVFAGVLLFYATEELLYVTGVVIDKRLPDAASVRRQATCAEMQVLFLETHPAR